MVRCTKLKVMLLLSGFIASAAYLRYFNHHLPVSYHSADFSKDFRELGETPLQFRVASSPFQSDVSARNNARNLHPTSRLGKGIEIPKILHYVFKGQSPYEDYKPLIRRCLQVNPDWSVYLWCDRDSQRLIREYYPHFAGKYASYRDRLEKSDSVRYMILHKFGGIYLDMDIECLQPFDKLLQFVNTSGTSGIAPESKTGMSSPVRAFLTEERREQTRILYGYSFCTMNSLMGSTPGHPFFESIIGWMKSMPDLNHARLSTGPDFLTKAYHRWLGCVKCHENSPVNVFPARLVSPLMDTSLVSWEEKCQPYFKVGKRRSDSSEEDRWRMLGCGELVAKGWLFDDTDSATVTVHRFLHLGYGYQGGRKSFDLLKEFPKIKTYYND